MPCSIRRRRRVEAAHLTVGRAASVAALVGVVVGLASIAIVSALPAPLRLCELRPPFACIDARLSGENYLGRDAPFVFDGPLAFGWASASLIGAPALALLAARASARGRRRAAVLLALPALAPVLLFLSGTYALMPFHLIVAVLTLLAAVGVLVAAAGARGLLITASAVIVGGAIVVERPWSWCPPGAASAQRIELSGSFGDVVLDGERYRVGGSALLDYMPRVLLSPLDFRAIRHPVGVTASISASSREALGEPAFACFRVTRAGETWARRPTTHGTQTMADGYPPGAPPPVPNEAWRQASVNDGPEWSAGEMIRLELWLSLRGRDYVFVLPPFALMKGG